MSLKYWQFSVLLAAMTISPLAAQAEIVQRQVIEAVQAQPGNDGNDGADVLSLAADNACGGRQVRMQASALGLDAATYIAMKADLARQVVSKAPIVVVIERCPKPGAGGLPEASRLGRCEGASCKDGKARLYLDKNFAPARQGEAQYQLLMPLPPGKVAGTWDVDIYEREGRIRYVSTHVDGPDYLYAKPVLSYISYHVDGQVRTEVPMNAQGQNNGVASRYYPDGSLAARGAWRNGLREGVHRTYHQKEGRLQQAAQYHAGVLADGVIETFNDEGKVVRRMPVRDGMANGEVLSYTDDGVLVSSRSYAKGMANGLSTWFFQDGQTSLAGQYVDDRPVGEHLDYRPDGTLASKQVYSEKGVLLSEQQFAPSQHAEQKGKQE